MDQVEHPAPEAAPPPAPIPEVAASPPPPATEEVQPPPVLQMTANPVAGAEPAPVPQPDDAVPVVWIKADQAEGEPVHVVRLPRATAEGLQVAGLVRPATEAEHAASPAP